MKNEDAQEAARLNVAARTKFAFASTEEAIYYPKHFTILEFEAEVDHAQAVADALRAIARETRRVRGLPPRVEDQVEVTVTCTVSIP